MVSKTEWMKRARGIRRALGLCIRCGKALDNFGTSCNACKGKIREQRNLNKDQYNERGRKFKAKRKEQGLCVACGKELEDKNFTNCEVCREKARAYGRDNPRKQATPEEMEKRRIWTQTLRAKRISEGLCPYCGKKRDRSEGIRCNECLEKQRKHKKASYEKSKNSEKSKGVKE